MQAASDATMPSPPMPWSLRGRVFSWGKQTYLMGVLNVTPDSFSDGGQFDRLETALQQAHYLATAGVDILDIGGQSTRPQAVAVPLEEELNRVIPVVQALREGALGYPPIELPISIDTTQSAVAQAAIAAGADLINDVSAGTADTAMFSTIAKLRVPVVLMHMRGTPQTMQQLTDYPDLIGELLNFLTARIQAATEVGIQRSQIAIDPGIGFAKTYSQNLEILRQLPKLHALQCPILVGTSRKSFIGHILNQPNPQERIWGTAATCSAAIAGGADILRVHDVKEMRDVCCVSDAIWRL